MPVRGRGDGVPLPDGIFRKGDDRFAGLRWRVIFGDDFRKPAWAIRD